MKYLVKATEIISSAKEDMDGEVSLSITDDIIELAESNFNFHRSTAWLDSYIGGAIYYHWRKISDEEAARYETIIKAYSSILQDTAWKEKIQGVTFPKKNRYGELIDDEEEEDY